MDQAIIKRRLIARAAEVKRVNYDRKFQIDIVALIHDPQWGAAQNSSDWRFHIDEEVKEVWASFSEQARLAMLINAESEARGADDA